MFADSPESLQTSLNILEEYSNKWKLTVNTEKTKVMIFGNGGRIPNNINFKYANKNLEIVKHFKYLGCVFTSGGAFNVMEKTLSDQALKAIFKLNNYLTKFTTLMPKHSMELFDKLISPIMNYAAEVWGFNKGLNIERIHLRFIKRLLGVKLSTQNNFVYGETGRMNFQNHRYIIIIKYWLKLCHANENKYIKSVYNILKTDIENHPNRNNWVSHVKRLLSTLGFYDVWLAQSVGNIKQFISLFKQRVKDVFIQNWESELSASTRATFYNTFLSFELQPYLSQITIPKFRIALSKLRMSSHRLEIECGRWKKPNSIPLNERICRFCGILEDEYHFVIECKLFLNLRKQYIKEYFWKRPSVQKFIQLIANGNQLDMKNLSIYVYKAFKLRQNSNYQ